MGLDLNRSFFSMFFALSLLLSGAAFAQEGPSLQASAEISRLREEWGRIVREKGELEEQREAWVRIVAQPYEEYLLLQKSIHFAELGARIDQLKREGKAAAQRLAFLGAPVEAPQMAFALDPPVQAFPTFSGAPPLSFHQANRVDEAFLYRPFWAPFSRFLVGTALLMIVIFPLAALIQSVRGRRRALAPVIQLPAAGRKRLGEEPPEEEVRKKKAA